MLEKIIFIWISWFFVFVLNYIVLFILFKLFTTFLEVKKVFMASIFLTLFYIILIIIGPYLPPINWYLFFWIQTFLISFIFMSFFEFSFFNSLIVSFIYNFLFKLIGAFIVIIVLIVTWIIYWIIWWNNKGEDKILIGNQGVEKYKIEGENSMILTHIIGLRKKINIEISKWASIEDIVIPINEYTFSNWSVKNKIELKSGVNYFVWNINYSKLNLEEWELIHPEWYDYIVWISNDKGLIIQVMWIMTKKDGSKYVHLEWNYDEDLISTEGYLNNMLEK